MYSLGDRLGKTLDEIGAMTHQEFLGWLAFHEIRGENK